MSWITLYPHWYRNERERMARRAPDFVVSEKSLAAGALEFAGEIRVDLGAEVRRFPVLLVYHPETPFRYPSLFPLNALPDGDQWTARDLICLESICWMPSGWRRHQMATGSMCLIETDARWEVQELSGVAILERARGVFRALALGEPHPYPDTRQAELDEHYDSLPADILLGDAFFDPGIAGGGTFFAIPTLDDRPGSPNYVRQTEPSRTLYIGLHLTAWGPEGKTLETEWRTEQSNALRAAFPFLEDQRLAFEAQTVRPGGLFADFGISGPWFDLKAEPEPVRTVRDLELVLQDLSGVADPLNVMLRNARETSSGLCVFLGLRYPERGGGMDWLYLFAASTEVLDNDVKASERPGALRDILRGGRVTALRRHAVRREQLELRNGTMAGTLADRSVLVLGVGALGGDVADALGKAGVGRLVVVDPDRMGPGNSIRHVAGLAATGLRKPDAIQQYILQHNPFVRVDAVPYSATDPLDSLDELMTRVDLVVSTIADENAEHVVNEAAVRLGRTVVYGRALRAGSASRVFRVRPGRDACKACLALYRSEAKRRSIAEGGTGLGGAIDTVFREWVNVPELEGQVVAHECGNPVLAGSSVDLRFSADLTARAVLDELQGTGWSGENGWNSLVWTREPLPEPTHPDLRRPYGTLLLRIGPHPDCPVCVRPRVRAIVLIGTAEQDLRRLAESKPDKETGGALIGFEAAGGTVVVLEVSDAGPKAIETTARFVYDPDHVNSRLRDAFARLGERGLYVGEWHTHLEPSPRPSARDATSLSAIAEEPAYLTDEPVMLIVGVDPRTGRVQDIHASCWPNQRAMHEIGTVAVVANAAALELPLRVAPPR